MLCRNLSLSSQESTKNVLLAQERYHYNSEIKRDYFKEYNKKEK